MIKLKSLISESSGVLGYIKPATSFYTLSEWKTFVIRMLRLQREGYDTRGGKVGDNPELLHLINNYFNYQLYVETERYDLLTTKNVLDFIEDFVNHRFWSFDDEYSKYFKDINSLKFAYFYSRGDIEPYVLLDENYTMQMYGSLDNPKRVLHYTTEEGVNRIQRIIDSGKEIDISAFTVAERPFFREKSNVIVEMIANVKAGFKSDIKSYAVDNGRRACNLYRLGYPDKREIDIYEGENNICYELDSCDSGVATSLWNEYIVSPRKIISVTLT